MMHVTCISNRRSVDSKEPTPHHDIAREYHSPGLGQSFVRPIVARGKASNPPRGDAENGVCGRRVSISQLPDVSFFESRAIAHEYYPWQCIITR